MKHLLVVFLFTIHTPFIKAERVIYHLPKKVETELLKQIEVYTNSKVGLQIQFSNKYEFSLSILLNSKDELLSSTNRYVFINNQYIPIFFEQERYFLIKDKHPSSVYIRLRSDGISIHYNIKEDSIKVCAGQMLKR